MAQHIIRDSKGRVEKILDDKEYAKYNNKQGCYSIIIASFIIISLVYAYNSDKDTPSKSKSEVSSESHHESSKTDEEVITIQEAANIEDSSTNETEASSEEFEEEKEDKSVSDENVEESKVIDEEELVRRFNEEKTMN